MLINSFQRDPGDDKLPLGMGGLRVFPSGTSAPPAVREIAAQVESEGGAALCAFQEPIGQNWHLFALLPAALVEPTPFQRDLSRTHTTRLLEVMKKLGRYTEPIVAVRAGPSKYWIPNGNHRRAAAVQLGANTLPAILIPELNVAYQILALNTEKAHNLRDKALEVARMYRAKLANSPGTAERALAFEFERPHFATLGLVYEKNRGFPAPFMRRC